MTNMYENIANYLILTLVVMIIAGGLFILWYLSTLKYAARKKVHDNASACAKAQTIRQKINLTDYFWSDGFRFAWIMLVFIFVIAFLLILSSPLSFFFAFLFTLAMGFFLIFAYKSFKNFPIKAKEALGKFESQVEAAMQKEISFKGDNIQVFSDEDKEFDTQPQIFKFPVVDVKIIFPPLSGKKSIVTEKKLEFLILSREYFSICQKGATFNLLNPANDPKKGCAEKAGGIGECNEFYYSQMRNVQYDGEAIRIIYSDGQEDAVFKCKKGPEQKAAMKALQEKLRLTERQKLKKIEEHKLYEDLKEKRIRSDEGDENEESDEESKDT